MVVEAVLVIEYEAPIQTNDAASVAASWSVIVGRAVAIAVKSSAANKVAISNEMIISQNLASRCAPVGGGSAPVNMSSVSSLLA
jgi:hypothetical protein